MRGKGSKLGEPCPKVRLSQDRLPIEPLTQQEFSGLLRFGILAFGIITSGKSWWRQKNVEKKNFRRQKNDLFASKEETQNVKVKKWGNIRRTIEISLNRLINGA